VAAASLVVRISADINDFAKNLNQMTRDVDRAAKRISDVGKAMTLGITLPVGLAAAALSKMALENDAVAARMRGSFGPAVDQVNGFLEKLGKVAPVAGTELQKMAVDINNVATGMGMAAPKAALLTESVLTMANDLSAKTGASMGEATEALTRGLEGSTKQLKSLGVVINETQVKQEAYRLGLMKIGQELTPLGTALATYSLLQKQSSQFTGAAASVHQTAARQFAMFTTAASELADRLSNLLLPALVTIARAGTALIDALQKIPDWVYGTAFAFAAFAAGIGPAIIAVANITALLVKLREAFVLLTAAEMLAKIKGLFALLMDPKILVPMIALAGAIAGVMYLWDRFVKKVEEQPKIAPPVDVKALMGGGGPTATFGNELQELQKQAAGVFKSFDLGVHFGDRMQGHLEALNALNAEAVKLYGQQADKMGEVAIAAREVMQRVQEIVALQNVSRAATPFATGPAARRRRSGSRDADPFSR
jgi:hypothetical protein